MAPAYTYPVHLASLQRCPACGDILLADDGLCVSQCKWPPKGAMRSSPRPRAARRPARRTPVALPVDLDDAQALAAAAASLRWTLSWVGIRLAELQAKPREDAVLARILAGVEAARK